MYPLATIDFAIIFVALANKKRQKDRTEEETESLVYDGNVTFDVFPSNLFYSTETSSGERSVWEKKS